MCECTVSSSFHDIRLEYADSFAIAAIAGRKRERAELLLLRVSYNRRTEQAANRVKMT